MRLKDKIPAFEFGWNDEFETDIRSHAGKTITLIDYRASVDGKSHRFNLHSKHGGLDWHRNGEWYISDMTDKQFKTIFQVVEPVQLPEELFTL
jgi:hypothetical protein